MANLAAMKRLYPVLLSLLSGFILSLAWPAAGFPALLFVAFIPLFYMEEQISGRLAAVKIWACSYLAFFTWNLLTTYWVYNSSPEGGYIAVIFNSLFMSWAYYLAYLTKTRLGEKHGAWALILYWITFEYWHLNWELSWPWLNLGNGFASYPEWIQWYEYTGTLGGSIWIILVNILLYRAIRHFSVPKAISAGVFLIIPLSISYIRYFTYEEEINPVKIAVIQPNIDPWNEKFEAGTQEEQFIKLLRLAQTQKSENPDYFVFPETALPRSFWNFERDTLADIQIMREFLKTSLKSKIVIGVSYLELFETQNPDTLPISASRFSRKPGSYYDDYNSAIQIDTSVHVPVYHKSKLVPGPESFPFAKYLKPYQEKLFGDLGGMIGNLGTQPERSVFSASDREDLAVGPIICYESIYGEFVSGYVNEGAGLLFIITNDGWWGNTPGYRQHFQYARLRAIENRRSIARSANTGISGFINQRGDVLKQTPYWEDAAITETLNANSSLTFYAKNGDYLGRLSAFTGILLLIYGFVKGFLKKRKS